MLSIAVLAFAAWVHVAIIDPTNAGWLLLGQDIGQNALGLAAYLRAGAWPGTHQAMLSAPEGVSLLFTDSNPLLGLMLWPLARWMPPGLQFVGPWLFACLLLHVLFAWLLVRRAADNFLTAWLGTALLTLLPTLFNRLNHSNLCAHWLILWALWIFVEPRRARSPWWWGAVLGVAALVHPYLLVMVAAIWGSALLAALFERSAAVIRLGLGHAAVAALVIGLTALNGVFGGQFESTGTFGAFPMAIDALFNPANPSYSALLPSTPEDRGRGFEGLQYLGAGLLFLLVTAVPIAITCRAPLFDSARLGRFAWLVPAFVVLTAIALGHHITYRGETIAVVPLTDHIIDLLDPIRAGGRMFWPVAYTLVLMGITVACRLQNGRAALILACAVALQIIDIAPMFAALRTLTATAQDRTTFRRTVDPRWPAIIAGASTVEFHPPEVTRDLQLMEEISWRVVLGCRTTQFTYASRMSAVTRARLAQQGAALREGRIDPTHLYIFFDPSVVPPSLRSRTRRIDGITFIPPAGRGRALAGCR